jgi:hypothetical protein
MLRIWIGLHVRKGLREHRPCLPSYTLTPSVLPPIVTLQSIRPKRIWEKALSTSAEVVRFSLCISHRVGLYGAEKGSHFSSTRPSSLITHSSRIRAQVLSTKGDDLLPKAGRIEEPERATEESSPVISVEQ